MSVGSVESMLSTKTWKGEMRCSHSKKDAQYVYLLFVCRDYKLQKR